MQTFLPYPDFFKSARVLDVRRLCKQRLEARQLIKIIEFDLKSPWKNHPACKMWKKNLLSLKLYYNCILAEWIKRGYKNSMPFDFSVIDAGILKHPDWLGDERVHSSHRANLLRKKPEYYSQFGWTEQPQEGYYWPE